MPTNQEASPKKMRKHLFPRRFCLFTIGCLMLLVLLRIAFQGKGYLYPMRSDYGQQLSLGQAQSKIEISLPSQASRISYYQRNAPGRVVSLDFEIDEPSFLEWAAHQQWDAKPIVGAIRVDVLDHQGKVGKTVQVTEGHYYTTLLRGEPNTMSVVFDRPNTHAYYYFQSAPVYGDR